VPILGFVALLATGLPAAPAATQAVDAPRLPQSSTLQAHTAARPAAVLDPDRAPADTAAPSLAASQRFEASVAPAVLGSGLGFGLGFYLASVQADRGTKDLGMVLTLGFAGELVGSTLLSAAGAQGLGRPGPDVRPVGGRGADRRHAGHLRAPSGGRIGGSLPTWPATPWARASRLRS
jgi:hypothetical protein